MKSLDKKTAVITGAASGIGRALAVQLAAEGCALAIADVNDTGLKETANLVKGAGVDVMTAKLDVSSEKDVNKFAAAVVKRFGSVDIVINNAGVNHNGNMMDASIEDFEWIFGINFWGVVYGTRAFLPHLVKRSEASLVNISSLFGLLSVRKQSAYCATKFAVRGFTEALRQELRATGVAVTCVHPGGIKTNIAHTARISTAGGRGSKQDQEKLIKLFDRVAATSPEEAARVIIDGIKKKRPRVLIGKDAKFGCLVQRLFPAIYDRVLEKIL